MRNSALILFSLHRASLDGYPAEQPTSPSVDIDLLFDRLLFDTVERFSLIDYAIPIVYTAHDRERKRIETDFPRIRAMPQTGDTLQERIRASVEETFDAGYRHVVLALSPVATLPHRIPSCAFTLLDTLEDVVVLAPTVQGSCYLIGMRHPHEAVLNVGDLDAPNMYEDLLRAIPATDMALYLLHSWRDIRSLDDAHALWTQIQLYPATQGMLPRTTRFLQEHAAQLFPHYPIA